MSDDFEHECRLKFEHYCKCYKAAAFHSLKRQYAEKAYGVIDDWLAWKEIQAL